MNKDRVLYKVIIGVWEGGAYDKFLGNITLLNRRFESKQWAEEYVQYLTRLAHKVLSTLDSMFMCYTGVAIIRVTMSNELKKEKLKPLEFEAVFQLCRSEYYKKYPDNMVCQIIANPIYVPEVVYGWKRMEDKNDVWD